MSFERRALAKNGADISEHVEALRREGGAVAASALTFFFAHRGLTSEIDALLASPDQKTRWGAVRALSEVFQPLHADRLANALLDPDRQIQKQAFDGLEGARKDGQVVRPSDACLERLRAHPRPDIDELVYLWTTSDVLCRVCSCLDDLEIAGYVEKLPKAARDLVAIDETQRRCPLCETRYLLEWHEQYTDEWGEYGTWNLIRQPSTTRSDEALRAGLTHPLRRIQRECASVLAERARGDLAAFIPLLQTNKRDVRLRAMWPLSSIDDLSLLAPTLRTLLSDRDDDVRAAAARTLAKEHVRTGDLQAIAALLTVDDRYTRRPMLLALEEAKLDLSSLRETIEALARHADEDVHAPAKRLLHHIPKR